jgi:hypothetical protein
VKWSEELVEDVPVSFVTVMSTTCQPVPAGEVAVMEVSETMVKLAALPAKLDPRARVREAGA